MRHIYSLVALLLFVLVLGSAEEAPEAPSSSDESVSESEDDFSDIDDIDWSDFDENEDGTELEDADQDDDEFLSSVKKYFSGVASDYKWAYHYYSHKVVKEEKYFARHISADYRLAGQKLRGLASHLKEKIEDVQNHAAATLLSGMKWSRSHALKLMSEYEEMESALAKEGGALYRKVKDKIKKWGQILRWTIDHSAPDLLVMGISGQAGPGLLGSECVLDFTKNSQAIFGYAGVSCGLNSGSLGASVGVGVCWKGQARSQSLKDAYSGWFGVGNADIALPGDLLSAGAAVAMSFARDSKGVLKPHPELCKCGQVHIGAGVSLNPLPGSVDVQLTDYKYLTGRSNMDNTQMVMTIVQSFSGDPFMMSIGMALTYANKKY